MTARERTWAWVLGAIGLGLAWLLYGLLTMTDPAPLHPHPEGSPAYTGRRTSRKRERR
jgi:hypothetical protein